jgi:hypothetical protein
MTRSEELAQEYETRRVELIRDIHEQRVPVVARIDKNRATAREHMAKSKDHSKQMRSKEANEALEQVSKLQAIIRDDEALLKRLDDDLGLIHSGRHPDLASLQSCMKIVGDTERQTEFAEARAAFDALLTTELKEAAQRLAKASRTVNQKALDLGQILLEGN